MRLTEDLFISCLLYVMILYVQGKGDKFSKVREEITRDMFLQTHFNWIYGNYIIMLMNFNIIK